MVGSRKDFLGGALMLVLGLGAVAQAMNYDLGTLRRMGPGFFPAALGVILAATGALIIIGGWRTAPQERGVRRAPEWRGWFCIGAGIVAFCVIGQHAGLAPATFAIVFISALGDRQNSVLAAFLLALAMLVACIVVFWWALQLQFPLVRWG